jgi:hypothetical protein
MGFEVNRVTLGLAFLRTMRFFPATYHSANISLVRGWYSRASYQAAQMLLCPTIAATTTTCVCNLLEMREIGDYIYLLFFYFILFLVLHVLMLWLS